MDNFVPDREKIKKRMTFNRLFVKTPCGICEEPQWFEDLHLVEIGDLISMVVCPDCNVSIETGREPQP